MSQIILFCVREPIWSLSDEEVIDMMGDENIKRQERALRSFDEENLGMKPLAEKTTHVKCSVRTQ